MFNKRGARTYMGAVIVMLASWVTPYPIRGEQAHPSLIDHTNSQWTELLAWNPVACSSLHRHQRLIVAYRADDKTPWTAADVVSGDNLSKLISSGRGPKPVIIQVGIEALFKDAHIPDAIFAGPAAEPEGLALLKAKAKAIPRTKEIVIYCGCCPWQDCPNIRPAFAALRQMGFNKLKLLSIPTDFQQDWVNKGFPTVRS